MSYQRYPSDLTDTQWQSAKRDSDGTTGGRPRSLHMRQGGNAVLDVVVGGIPWRMPPREYPKWQSVDQYFRCCSVCIVRSSKQVYGCGTRGSAMDLRCHCVTPIR